MWKVSPGVLIADRYRLGGILGTGGMGAVYRAEDERLHGRPCAIKVLSSVSPSPADQRRFEREISIIARLRSPHIVQVFDTGTLPDGGTFIVMELLEGETLASLVQREGALAPARAVEIALGIADALAEAHHQSIIHRDLKPANVFVARAPSGRELPKVLDFGIAKDVASHGGADLTGGQLFGTPRYMAPEQFMSRPADARSDLYSLGLLLHEMLGGRPAFDLSMPVPPELALMSAALRFGYLHVNSAPAPLVGVPAEVAAVVARLLAKSPERRYQSAAEVVAALRPEMAFAAGGPGEPIDAPTLSTGVLLVGEAMGATGARSPVRSAGRAAVLAGVALTAGLGVWALAHRGEPPPDVAPATAICVDDVETTPPGASVLRGGVAIGTTPLRLERPCDEARPVRLELAGFEPASLQLEGAESARWHEALLPLPAPGPAAEAVDPPPEDPASRPGAVNIPAPSPATAAPRAAPAPRPQPAGRPVRTEVPKPPPATPKPPVAKPAPAPTPPPPPSASPLPF